MDRRINDETTLRNCNGVPFLSFTALDRLDFVRHGFSTRLGGVSSGIFESMNLSFERGDDAELVHENFRRIADSIGFDCEKTVLTNQWHTTNVRVVDMSLAGQGIISPRTEDEIDGQITNVPGITLLAYGADCTPVFLVDPVHRAIGLCHSGWKGTLNNISRVTVELMCSTYGSDPLDIVAVVGPSICSDCYEVGEDVAGPFSKLHARSLRQGARDGKFQLDLWQANYDNLLAAGLNKNNISVSGFCTKCHPELMFSHRGMGSARGSMAGFLTITEE